MPIIAQVYWNVNLCIIVLKDQFINVLKAIKHKYISEK